MKPVVIFVILVGSLVVADLVFTHGEGLRAFERWFSHLIHQRIVE
jgi:hypothetical protein